MEKVICYLTRGHQILVFDQNDTSAPPMQLIKGGIDPGERPEEAAVREVFEESGLRVQNPRLLGCRLRSFRWEGRWHSVYFYYFCFDVGDDCPDAWEHVVSGGDLDKGLVFSHRFVDRAGLRLGWGFDLLFPQLESYKECRARIEIYVTKGQGLYVFRTRNPGDGWQVPAGNIGAGESLEQAARRLLREQCGFDAESLRDLGKATLSDGQLRCGFHFQAPEDTPDRFEHEASTTHYFSLTPKLQPELDWNMGALLDRITK